MSANPKTVRRLGTRASARGFTVIELLVVIAIISILSSIVIVSTVTYRNRALASRVTQEVASFQHAAAIFYIDAQQYPDPASASNVAAACYNAADPDLPELCCVSQEGCLYAGEALDTLAADGDFATAPAQAHRLALFAERAYAVLDGKLPEFLTEAPNAYGASAGSYRGVFYECESGTCQDGRVVFTVPVATCPRGVAHNGLEGVCEQSVTAVD